jgi:hypothetical protein
MRNPQAEYLDGIGAGRPGRETMAQRRQPADIGRYGQRSPDAATRQMQDDWRAEVARMRERLDELERVS